MIRSLPKVGVDKDRILLFTKDSRKSQIDQFKGIEKVIKDKKIQIIIFSPVIKTGADISKTQFHRIYAFAYSNQSCSFRDFMQMIGRFRELETNQIRFIMTKNERQKTKVELMSELQQREHFRQKYYKKIAKNNLVSEFAFEENAVLHPVSTNTLFMEQYILNELEQHADFNKEFLKLCVKKNYNVTTTTYKPRHNKKHIELILKIKAQVEKELLEKKKKAVKKMVTDPRLAENTKHLIRSGKDVDEIDSLTVSMQPMASSIDMDKLNVENDWQLLEKNKHVYQRLKILTDAKQKGLDPISEYQTLRVTLRVITKMNYVI